MAQSKITPGQILKYPSCGLLRFKPSFAVFLLILEFELFSYYNYQSLKDKAIFINFTCQLG